MTPLNNAQPSAVKTHSARALWTTTRAQRNIVCSKVVESITQELARRPGPYERATQEFNVHRWHAQRGAIASRGLARIPSRLAWLTRPARKDEHALKLVDVVTLVALLLVQLHTQAQPRHNSPNVSRRIVLAKQRATQGFNVRRLHAQRGAIASRGLARIPSRLAWLTRPARKDEHALKLVDVVTQVALLVVQLHTQAQSRNNSLNASCRIVLAKVKWAKVKWGSQQPFKAASSLSMLPDFESD